MKLRLLFRSATRQIAYSIAFLGQFFTTIALSQDMPLWANAKNWSIRVDTTLGFGCFAMTEIDNGDGAFRIGINGFSKYPYIIIGHSSWRSLEQGNIYEMRMIFGDEMPWIGDATAVKFDPRGPNFLWIDFDTTEVIDEFMQEYKLSVEYKGNAIFDLPLDNSFIAGVEILDCQKQMDTIAKGDDPFAK